MKTTWRDPASLSLSCFRFHSSMYSVEVIKPCHFWRLLSLTSHASVSISYVLITISTMSLPTSHASVSISYVLITMSMISLMISSVMSSVSTYNEYVHIYILFITISYKDFKGLKHSSIQPNIIHRHHNPHVKSVGVGLSTFFAKNKK